MRRSLLPALALLAALAAAAPADAAIVVNGRYKSLSAKTRTITYTSSKGTYRAKLLAPRHYRLRGTINGMKLRGSFHTRPDGADRYAASGSGTHGGRHVSISGGGPNDLRTSRLVLR
jgi:hypothetical protein